MTQQFSPSVAVHSMAARVVKVLIQSDIFIACNFVNTHQRQL